VILRANAVEDVQPANNTETVQPSVVKVGDSTIRRKDRRGFSGTARRGAGALSARRLRVHHVDVALLREGGNGCSWLRSVSGAFTRRSAGACRARRWLRADGTGHWRFKLKGSLPAGHYVVYSRATIRAGFREARFSAKDRNRMAFEVG
jgi:hypothetical protein